MGKEKVDITAVALKRELVKKPNLLRTAIILRKSIWVKNCSSEPCPSWFNRTKTKIAPTREQVMKRYNNNYNNRNNTNAKYRGWRLGLLWLNTDIPIHLICVVRLKSKWKTITVQILLVIWGINRLGWTQIWVKVTVSL